MAFPGLGAAIGAGVQGFRTGEQEMRDLEDREQARQMEELRYQAAQEALRQSQELHPLEMQKSRYGVSALSREDALGEASQGYLLEAIPEKAQLEQKNRAWESGTLDRLQLERDKFAGAEQTIFNRWGGIDPKEALSRRAGWMNDADTNSLEYRRKQALLREAAKQGDNEATWKYLNSPPPKLSAHLVDYPAMRAQMRAEAAKLRELSKSAGKLTPEASARLAVLDATEQEYVDEVAYLASDRAARQQLQNARYNVRTGELVGGKAPPQEAPKAPAGSDIGQFLFYQFHGSQAPSKTTSKTPPKTPPKTPATAASKTPSTAASKASSKAPPPPAATGGGGKGGTPKAIKDALGGR